jgi:hypothetical protein
MTTITRDYTLRLYRHRTDFPVKGIITASHECEVVRGTNVTRYKNVTLSTVNRFADFLRDNDVEPEIDFKYFTEIEFSCDKEVDEEDEGTA